MGLVGHGGLLQVIRAVVTTRRGTRSPRASGGASYSQSHNPSRLYHRMSKTAKRAGTLRWSGIGTSVRYPRHEPSYGVRLGDCLWVLSQYGPPGQMDCKAGRP